MEDIKLQFKIKDEILTIEIPNKDLEKLSRLIYETLIDNKIDVKMTKEKESIVKLKNYERGKK